MSTEPSQREAHIRLWQQGYSGLLHDDRDPRFRSLIYGWDAQHGPAQASIPPQGAVWGFVQHGEAHLLWRDGRQRSLGPLEFFVTDNGAELDLSTGTRLFAVQQIGFRAVPMVGGPIEPRGRLRYIDGCSDSLLLAPFLLGDPCLNHLHFPSATTQTHHTHPSIRAGIVVRGAGSCTTPAGEIDLVPGLIFVIPVDGIHGFHTASEAMDVIAYHPDSDYGPRHEDHPMVNRTLVEGLKIDNRGGPHARAEVVEARFDVDAVVTSSGAAGRTKDTG